MSGGRVPKKKTDFVCVGLVFVTVVSDRVYSQLARRTTNEELHSKAVCEHKREVRTNTKGKCVQAHMEAGALGACTRGAGVAPYTEVCHIHHAPPKIKTYKCLSNQQKIKWKLHVRSK